jgi:hypothetical protein
MWWKMRFEGKKKIQRDYYDLFPFHNMIGLKKKGYNVRNNYKRTQVNYINVWKND